MTALAFLLLGVMMLDSPTLPDEGEIARRVAAQADSGMRGASGALEASGEKSATITSVRSDFDREAKVVMFEEDVTVTYAADYVLHADRLFVFLGGSNELTRIVAIGRVAITNETRVGECEMAKFLRRKGEIEMFGARDGRPARLRDVTGDDVAGSRIKFWLDTEQVEVSETDIRVKRREEDKVL